MQTRRIGASFFIYSLAFILPAGAHALTEMSDDTLSEVTGQDGLTVIMNSDNSGLSADAIRWTNDVGGFDADGNAAISAAEAAYEASFQFDTLSARSVDLTGSTLGAGPVTITQTLDAGTTVGNDPIMGYYLGVNRVRLQTEGLSVSSQPAVAGRSYGKWALDASMGMTIMNRGLFDASYDKAYVKGEVGRNQDTDVLEYGNLFYSQAGSGHAYMTMYEFHALWEMTEGTLGIDNDGILWRTGYGGDWANIPGGRSITESDVINLALDFDHLYKDPSIHGEVQDFVISSNDRGLMHFGWRGSVKDVEVRFRPGGTWSGTETLAGIGDVYNTANQSGGLNLAASWDYISLADATALGDIEKHEFRWRLGETSDICPGGVCSGSDDTSRINFELGDWTIWGSRIFGDDVSHPYENGLHAKPAASHFPLIALDAINGNQSAGGVCWGFAYNGPAATCNANDSQLIHIQPGYISDAYSASLRHSGDAGGFAVHVRDGQLQSFSRRIRLLERDGAGVTTETNFDWGLIYALANVDASFYLYPGGNSYDENTGIIADITLMSQTFDELNPEQQGFNWDHGTHLMIADTSMDGVNGTTIPRNAQGIGFLSSSFLLAANDTRIMLRDQASTADADYYDGGLDITSPAARFNYIATFGGGVLPDDSGAYGTGPRIVKAALLDFNLEGAVNLRFSPSNPNDTWQTAGGSQYTGPLNSTKNYLGYSAAIRFGSLNTAEGLSGVEQGTGGVGVGDGAGYGSYLSLAEPGRPDVAFLFANVEGDLAFTNGIVDLRGGAENTNGKPSMTIANNMLIGAAAGARVTEGFNGLDVAHYGAAGRELKAELMLGANTLGTVVIPSAQVYSSITLMPQ